MRINTTLLGEVEVDLVEHRRMQGLHSIVESIIEELTSTQSNDLLPQEKADLQLDITDQLFGMYAKGRRATSP
jgi:hypothetical protein